MCGIAGIVSFKHNPDPNKMDQMLFAIRHRGPDATGIANLDGCILGHQRLSIIDLNTGGQPMQCVQSGKTIVFNGEIYGYQQIKKNFKGYTFQTESDTEVILALNALYGEKLLEKLPGMFAFAIWDSQSKSLFCARDRFGEKPFYYAWGSNGEFIFASEIKSILASGLIQPELDLSSLSYYLKRLTTPVRKTIYKNIHVLPPAHYLICKEDSIKIERYWYPPAINHKISYKDAKDQFKGYFENSVGEQMVADVPVGAFLSGGVDSGSVVAVASRLSKSPLQTFSFGFEGTKNELKEARQTATLFNTDHTEFYENDFDIAAFFLQMQEIYDEPFGDSSNIPMYLISRFASKKLKVVLTGDGGDELLGGYNSWYQPMLGIGHSFKGKKLFYEAVNTLSKYYPISKYWKNKLTEFSHFKKGILAAEFHKNQNVYFSDAVIYDMGLPVAYDEFGLMLDLNTVDDAMRMDLQNYMPADILVKTDRASMANSIELRAPFLNVALAEFCLSLPYSFKLNQSWNKLLLRDYLKAEFPMFEQHPVKKGFGAPVDQWLMIPAMQTLKNDLLSSPKSKLYDYIPYDKAALYIGRNNYHSWVLLTLAAWLEKNN